MSVDVWCIWCSIVWGCHFTLVRAFSNNTAMEMTALGSIFVECMERALRANSKYVCMWCVWIWRFQALLCMYSMQCETVISPSCVLQIHCNEWQWQLYVVPHSTYYGTVLCWLQINEQQVRLYACLNSKMSLVFDAIWCHNLTLVLRCLKQWRWRLCVYLRWMYETGSCWRPEQTVCTFVGVSCFSVYAWICRYYGCLKQYEVVISRLRVIFCTNIM